MLLSININFIVFSFHKYRILGQVFSFYRLVVASAVSSIDLEWLFCTIVLEGINISLAQKSVLKYH